MKYDQTNWIYYNDNNNELRYILGEKGENILACIGVNPSTATPEKLDPTLKKVKRIAEFNEFDGWLMYNLYPQRATDPTDLHEEIDYEHKRNNNFAIVQSIKNLKIKTIWIAWGDLIKKRNYLYFCLIDIYEQLKEENIEWKIVDIPTMSGNPRHPLYQKSESKLSLFNMENYIENVAKKKIKGKKYEIVTINNVEFK